MKKNILTLLLIGFGFCACAQSVLSIETGYSREQNNGYLRQISSFQPVEDRPNKGFNIGIHYELPLYDRFGIDFGLAYFRVKVIDPFNSILFLNPSSQLPVFSNSETNEHRLATQVGFFYMPIVKNKWTWKIGSMSSLYYNDYSFKGLSAIRRSQLFDFNFGLSLKNSIKYDYKPNIQLIATQTYDAFSYISGDNDRFNFNVGIGYKFN